jgi:hypothetical protein
LQRDRTQLDDEARVTLELAAYARQGTRRPYEQVVDQLMATRLTPPVIKILTAQLISHPDSATLGRLCDRFRLEQVTFTSESAGAYFSLLCAAGANGDWTRFGELRAAITDRTASSAALLAAVEAFFRGRSSASRITSLLPALPLPLEVNYALISRYPGLPSGPGKSSP